MRNEIRELMEEVIEDNLQGLKGFDLTDIDSEQRKITLKETLELTDRLIQLEKLDLENDKQKQENKKFESNQNEIVFNKVMRIVEVAAVPTVLFIADCVFKTYYMKSVCNFEKYYTFTTTPGRGVSGLFKFRK